MAKVNLATCQFQVENTPQQNLRTIFRQMRIARQRGAHLVHFSDACLSGYLCAEITSLRKVDWDLVHEALEQVQDLCFPGPREMLLPHRPSVGDAYVLVLLMAPQQIPWIQLPMKMDLCRR